MSDPDGRLDLLEALIYGDTFNCAVTLEELWRYCGVAVGRDELRARIVGDEALSRLVCERDGLFCLAGRETLLDERAARRARARRLRRRGRWTARILRHLPFVRGLLLTGSAAADDAPPRADIDLLVIVAADRIGCVFLMMATMSSLTRRQLFCPNLYVSDNDLTMGPQGAYVAREVAQAVALVGDADALWAANDWVRELLPNVADAGRRHPGWPPDRPCSARSSVRSPGLWARASKGSRAASQSDACTPTTRRSARPCRGRGWTNLQAGRSLGFHRGRTDVRVARHRGDLRTRLARELARLDAIDAIDA